MDTHDPDFQHRHSGLEAGIQQPGRAIAKKPSLTSHEFLRPGLGPGQAPGERWPKQRSAPIDPKPILIPAVARSNLFEAMRRKTEWQETRQCALPDLPTYSDNYPAKRAENVSPKPGNCPGKQPVGLHLYDYSAKRAQHNATPALIEFRFKDLEHVLEPAALAIAALRAGSESSCTPMYTAGYSLPPWDSPLRGQPVAV
jgi:hypothetical protein